MDAGTVVFGLLTGETSAQDRIYPLLLPQDPTYPAVSYQQISAVRTHAMGVDGALVRVRLQVNLWGRTYAEARTLANDAIARMSRFRGPVAGLAVQDVLLDNELETYEPESEARRVIQDYTLFLSTT